MPQSPLRPIAFHAPLKSPDHHVPSGDRLMARQLMAALGGMRPVTLASPLRSYLRDPDDAASAAEITAQARAEIARLDADWRTNGPPSLWFCYHPYYKAPDLIGPTLCHRFGLPYVTAESSYSTRRNIGHWAASQALVLAGIRQAALNLCLTMRDQQGLVQSARQARTARLPPFIDTTPFSGPATPEPGRLITVAMMRPGDKAESYAFLAAALHRVTDLPWRLSVIGDGDHRPAIQSLLAPFADRIDWLGALPTSTIATHLARAQIYVWPGCGEAYGLAYLEAQAAGLPVIAQHIAGVPEVVAHGTSGLLTPAGDTAAYAGAIRQLLTDSALCHRMAHQARAHVTQHHGLVSAANRLSSLLSPLLESTP